MKRSFRFSLLTLFLLTTVVALGLSLTVTTSKLRGSRADLARMKNQFGELTISDKSQVHVIAVPTAEAWNWRWRIYLPGGHDFAIYANRGTLKAGLPLTDKLAMTDPVGGQSSPFEPREIVIDLALGKTAEGAPCLWMSENGRSEGPLTFDGSLPSWAAGGVMYLEEIAGQGSTLAGPVTTPLGLIRIDGVGDGGTTCEDAILMWIGLYEKTPTQSLRDRGILPKSN